MDKDIDVHDSRSTEESVASYSYSACVGSTAWDWSHRQIQFELWTKHMLFSTLAACMYRFPTTIHHWCCSTTGAVTEATCIPLSEQTDWPWQLINFCTMLVLSNQNVKNPNFAEHAVWYYPYNTNKAGCWIRTGPHPPSVTNSSSFALKTSLDLGKQTSSGVTTCQTFYGQ